MFQRFKALIDSLLEQCLAELGVSAEQLESVLTSDHEDELSAFILQFVAAADDFVQFRAMMTKANLQLDQEVLNVYARGGRAAPDHAAERVSETRTDADAASQAQSARWFFRSSESRDNARATKGARGSTEGAARGTSGGGAERDSDDADTPHIGALTSDRQLEEVGGGRKDRARVWGRWERGERRPQPVRLSAHADPGGVAAGG